jgi:hypothetical protein
MSDPVKDSTTPGDTTTSVKPAGRCLSHAAPPSASWCAVSGIRALSGFSFAESIRASALFPESNTLPPGSLLELQPAIPTMPTSAAPEATAVTRVPKMVKLM